MILLARLLSRLTGVLLLALIAAVGVLAALFCIDGGTGTLSLHKLATHLRLPAVRDDLHAFLAQITAPGSVAVIALLAGLAAVAIGLILIVGCWVRPRPRQVVLAHTDLGVLSGLRRPLRHAIAERASAPAEVSSARVKIRVDKRADGARSRVILRAPVGVSRRTTREAASAATGSFTEPLPLQMRFRARSATRRQRKAAQG